MPGLTSASPVVSPEFFSLWEEATVQSPDDLLGFIEAQRPDLAGMLYELSAGFGPAGFKGQQTPCNCRWVTLKGATEGDSEPDMNSGPMAETKTYWVEGLQGYIAGQTKHGTAQETMAARFAALGLHLVCTTTAGSTPRVVEINDRSEIASLSFLSSCGSPCEASVTHQGSSTLCAEGRVFSGAGLKASADLWLESELTLDGVVQPLARAEVDIRSGPSMDMRENQVTESFTELVIAPGSTGVLDLTGFYEIDAARDRSSGEGSYAYASLFSDFTYSVAGTADCAVNSGAAEFDVPRRPDSGGGEVLMRWGDPP